MAKRRIVIPEGVICPDCGSNDLTGRGTDWRGNPNGDNPPRVLVELLRCKGCGKIFDGFVTNAEKEFLGYLKGKHIGGNSYGESRRKTKK